MKLVVCSTPWKRDLTSYSKHQSSTNILGKRGFLKEKRICTCLKMAKATLVRGISMTERRAERTCSKKWRMRPPHIGLTESNCSILQKWVATPLV